MPLSEIASKRRRLLVYGLLLSIHVALAALFVMDRSPATNAGLTGFPLDDAWIHLVYGRSLAHHGLPYYNTGVLEAGFTSPLWMVLLAIAELLSSLLAAPPTVIVKVITVICASSASMAAYELCRKLTGRLGLSLLGAVLVAASPTIAFSQLSGMEVCLASSLMLWAVVAFMNSRLYLCGILLALSCLTRPECWVLALLIIAAQLVSPAEKRLSTRLMDSLKLALPAVGISLLWSGYCLSVSGHPLPNTFYAKYSASYFFGDLGVVLSEVVLKMSAMWPYVGAILYVVGAVTIVRKRKMSSLVPLVFPWAFLVGIAATRPMPPGCGSYFYWLRYTIPALPFLVVPMIAGLGWLWHEAGRSKSPVAAAALRYLLLAVAALLLVRYPAEMAFRKSQFAWNCQNINEVQVEFGKWVRRNTPKDAVVLVNDAGAIRYFGERQTIDLIGLNDHALLFDRATHYGVTRNANALADFMKSKKADYLIVFPSIFPALTGNEFFRAHFTPAARFESRNYTITSFPQDMMVAFFLAP